jgi:hypothetical protein
MTKNLTLIGAVVGTTMALGAAGAVAQTVDTSSSNSTTTTTYTTTTAPVVTPNPTIVRASPNGAVVQAVPVTTSTSVTYVPQEPLPGGSKQPGVTYYWTDPATGVTYQQADPFHQRDEKGFAQQHQ